MPNSRGISGGRGGKAGPEKGQREQDGPLEEGARRPWRAGVRTRLRLRPRDLAGHTCTRPPHPTP